MGKFFILDPIVHPNFILILLCLAQICGLYYFTFGGFFVSQAPLRAPSTSAHQHGVVAFELPSSLAQRTSDVRPFYDRLVFMVIDALRYDFVFGNTSRFDYLNQELKTGQAVGFISLARPPTVTLPRLKALTSGSISNFLDVILNFDTRELKEDSWVQRFYADLKFRMNFFGDDTWLKLFPKQFQRFEGVTSFYVTDTVQVDLNVTRHLSREMAQSDWDVMILHYLGLDHIGHCYGAQNSVMDAKQAEMDRVIESIHRTLLADQNTTRSLFVICGDHGMTNGGNHGGSSYDESAPAAIFLSSYDSWRPIVATLTGPREIAQVDMVPTLSLLFGSQIPEHSNGRLIRELFPVHGIELLQYYYLNALQIFKSIGYYQIPFTEMDIFALKDTLARNHYSKEPQHFTLRYYLALQFHTLACDEQEPLKRDSWLKEANFYYQEYLDSAYEYKSMTTSGFGFYQMFLGVLFLLLNVLAFVSYLLHLTRRATLLYRPSHLYAVITQLVWIGLLANLFYEYAPIFSRSETMDLLNDMPHILLFILLSLFPLQLLYVVNMSVDVDFAFTIRFKSEFYLILTFVGSYMASLFSSSFIEEEYCFWYFWTATLALYFFVKRWNETKKSIWPFTLSSRLSSSWYILSVPVLMRCIMHWNHTGCLFEHVKDIRYYITQFPPTEDALFLSSLFCFTLFCFWWYHTYPILSSFSVIRTTVSCFNCVFILLQSFLLLLFKYAHIFLVAENEAGCLVFELPSTMQFAKMTYVSLVLQLSAMILFASFTEESKSRTSIKIAIAHSMVPLSGILFLLLQRAYQSCHLIVFILQGLALGRLSAWLSRRSTVRVSEKMTGFLFQILYFCTLRASYFLLGQSNLVATIDLSNAYTGLDDYYVGCVGILLFLVTWGGPFIFVFLYPVVIHPAQWSVSEHVTLPLAFLATMTSFFQMALVIADITFLNHLFIWSVFSPRHLYELFWIVFYFLWMIVYPICISDDETRN